MAAPLALPQHILQHPFADAAALAAVLAEGVAALLQAGLGQRGQASLVVSGGRSPEAFLRVLGAKALDWSRVFVTLADERWLPPGHADSNAGMVRRTLLQGPAAAARFVPLYGGEGTPEEGVEAARLRLSALPRPFDAVVLGMGEDGHTASLFPGAAGLAALFEADAPVLAAVHPPAAPHARITLTLPALLDARHVFLQIQGAAKEAVLERAAAGGDPLRFPIAAVLAQRRVPVHVYCTP